MVKILSTAFLDLPLIALAARSNIEIETTELINIKPITGKLIRSKVQEFATQPATVLFTSTNAVENVANLLDGKSPEWKIFCIEGATSEMIKKRFTKSNMLATAKNAAEMAEKILESKETDGIVFFCGDQRRDELPSKLAEHRVRLAEVIVYETILAPQKFEKNYDGILFFSPSAVTSFFLANELHGNTVLFAIGHTTAASIKQNISNTVITSTFPRKEKLIEEVISYFTKINRNA